MMLFGSIYRPGPRKNLVFSIYGACAPMGFFIGIFFSGLTAQFSTEQNSTWRWYFFIGTLLSALTTIVAYFSVPSDSQARKAMGVKMDWIGSIFIVSGLILLVFAITDSAHAPNGWATPYIPILLVVGLIMLSIAVYVEGWRAPSPLLPFDFFKVSQMKPLLIALFLQYGSLGIFFLYATFYIAYVKDGTPLQIVAWYVPMALGGCIISTVGAFVLHLLPGTVLIVISSLAWIMAPLLFAIAPLDASYWPYFFPSMLCATIGIDITWNVTNIFITTSLPSRRQGLAGAVINSILHLGISLFLGFADVVAIETGNRINEPNEVEKFRRTYQNVFWLEVACAAVALIILVLFVKIGKAKSDLTEDERQEIASQEVALNNSTTT